MKRIVKQVRRVYLADFCPRRSRNVFMSIRLASQPGLDKPFPVIYRFLCGLEGKILQRRLHGHRSKKAISIRSIREDRMKKWFQVLSLGAIGLVISLSNQFDSRPFGAIQSHERQESAHNRAEAIKNTGNFKSPKIHPNYGKIPLYFIPNKGQVDARALFYAKTRS